MRWYYVEYGNHYFDEISQYAKDEEEAKKIYEEKSKQYNFCEIVAYGAGR